MAKTATKRPQRDRRQEILEAASRVITERGMAETRIQDIAEVCGVSPGTVASRLNRGLRDLGRALDGDGGG